MTWTFIWMAVVLKIPVFALLWLCWWAVREAPDPATDQADADGGGGTGHPPGPRRPQHPRRGDHAAPPRPPSRVRAAGRSSDSVRER